MIQPAAVIVSQVALMMAAGATLLRFRRYRVYEPTVEPLPLGKTSTLPAMDCPSSSCPRSITTPLSGSTPPKKEIPIVTRVVSKLREHLEKGDLGVGRVGQAPSTVAIASIST